MLTIGIDVGGTNIAVGVVNDQNEIIARATAKIHVPCPHKDLRSQILEVVKIAMKNASAGWKDIAAIGLGIPGAVDSSNGIVTISSNLFVENFKAKELLEQIVECPVYVINDANAAAYGEFVCGSLQGANNALALTLGTGIGCGLILNGKLHCGIHDSAGEIGHMVIEMDGRLCNCGRKGCWERYASATGLIQTTREYLITHPELNRPMMTMIGGNISNIDGKTAFEGKKNQYPLGAEIVDLYVSHLACGLVNVINLLDPDRICIGGGVSSAGDALMIPLKEHVLHDLYNRSQKEVDLVFAQLGNDAGIIGAACYGRSLLLETMES